MGIRLKQLWKLWMSCEQRDESRVVGIRVFRPWPLEQLAQVLKNVKAIAALIVQAHMVRLVMLFNEIAGTLFIPIQKQY